jgi:hypothetical protein
MSGAIHPLPQYAFMAWCLVKAQGQLYLFYDDGLMVMMMMMMMMKIFVS